MVIDGRLFNASVSKSGGNLSQNFYFEPSCVGIYCAEVGEVKVSVLVCLPLVLRFAPFSYNLVCFLASNCHQISFFTILS